MRFGLICVVAALTPLWGQNEPQYVFGTTVVDSSGLHGDVFYIKDGAEKLPKLRHLKPVGSVYTTTLNVWPQQFTEGFPSITDRVEWFAIDYTGKVWIERSGPYRFSLLSDDGSKLKLDGKVVVNNDGVHGPAGRSASATLTRGVHEIEVQYFQGPRFTVALVLAIAPPGEAWRIFDMRDFKPPKDPEEWTKGKISGIGGQTVP